MTASNNQSGQIAEWKRLVTVNPVDVIFRDQPDADGKFNSFIDLSNRSNQNMLFKVKTTDPTKFIVKPNQGQLSPESSTRVQIQFIGNIT